MKAINAYIGFQGKCREAMNYYKECLGGDLELQTVADSPMAAQCPESVQAHILHSTLTAGPVIVMGTDMAGPDGYVQGNNIALCVICSSEEEINKLYTKLGDGGTVLCPLKEEFWATTFGVVKDKYGIDWMLNYDKNAQQ